MGSAGFDIAVKKESRKFFHTPCRNGAGAVDCLAKVAIGRPQLKDRRHAHH
jgi:hypothetical protein